jgi:hypothetical protein
MITTTYILKCILLAKTHVLTLEMPVNEYGMATLNRLHNGVQFEATVMEERMNSVRITFPKQKTETTAFSTRGYEMKALSTHLNIGKEHASMDCEIN